MMKSHTIRSAFTLIECIVVLAILLLLIGLILPAIHKIRAAALSIQSSNNLKQISLAAQNFASSHNSKLPTLHRQGGPGDPNADGLFVGLLPFLEQDAVYEKLRPKPLIIGESGEILGGMPSMPSGGNEMKIFLDPTDPTLSQPASSINTAYSSYAANMLVFRNARSLDNGFPDGLSSTILFTTHYAKNCNGFEFFYIYARGGPTLERHPTFADVYGWVLGGTYWPDYGPLTSANPPVSRAYQNVTFQVAPKINECDSRLPQATTPSGLRIALGDGCVRVLAPNIEPSMFWGAVTPDKGEVIDIN